MEPGEAYFLVRVTTAEKPPGWEAGMLKRIRLETKFLFGQYGQVTMAKRVNSDPLVVGQWEVLADPQRVMCGMTRDDAECACGCSGYDDRCDHWQQRYEAAQEVDDTHTCCKVKEKRAPTHKELVEMPENELKRLPLGSPQIWDRWRESFRG